MLKTEDANTKSPPKYIPTYTCFKSNPTYISNDTCFRSYVDFYTISIRRRLCPLFINQKCLVHITHNYLIKVYKPIKADRHSLDSSMPDPIRRNKNPERIPKKKKKRRNMKGKVVIQKEKKLL